MLMGRTEQRGAVNFKARLRSVGVPSYFEAVSIRNVSLHGAQVVTLRPLRVQSRVELIAAMGLSRRRGGRLLQATGRRPVCGRALVPERRCARLTVVHPALCGERPSPALRAAE